MPDAPVDLSKLPRLPEGLRWERTSETEITLMLGARTNVGSIIYENEGGDEWWYSSYYDDEKQTWVSSDGMVCDLEASDALLSALGLSPAPAPERTFTEGEVKVLMEDCLFAGAVIRDQHRLIFSGQLTGGTCEPQDTPKELAEAVLARKHNVGIESAREFHEMAYIQSVFQEYITAALAAAKKGQ